MPDGPAVRLGGWVRLFGKLAAINSKKHTAAYINRFAFDCRRRRKQAKYLVYFFRINSGMAVANRRFCCKQLAGNLLEQFD